MLGQRERHALAETTYAVLRRMPQLQHLAQGGRGALERRLAILGWGGDAAFLDAALTGDERDWLQQVRAIDLEALAETLRHNLPLWLAQALKHELPAGEFWPLVKALNEPAGLDLRVNVLKCRREDALLALQGAGVAARPTPYSPWGLRLDGKPAVNRLPMFVAGEIEVQDEGSQLLALVTGAARGEMVVDFCAGAGGKTLALGAMMRSTGRLYAFDVAAHRLDALKPRLKRSGLSNVHPAAISHERDERVKRLAGKIDRVLVDAPCTGLGTLRRNPDLKWRQGAAAVQELQARQIALLAAASRLLRPGGRLVYGTCSLLAAENERVCEAFEARHGGTFEPLAMAGLLAAAKVEAADSLCSGPYLRLWPHRHGSDGFFAAAWQRKP